jgi:TolB-like protein
MNRSIIIAAVVISAAILLNGYFDRAARAPHAAQSPEKQPPTVREKSIAVLPFQDLSSSEQKAGFADGIQQEIINRLTKVHDLKVVSQSDVMRYKATERRNPRDIGQQLGAANLLQGSVQRSENQVRVNVQLIDAKTDTHLWAETYDRQLTDVFAVESEIAKNIADQLGARLSSAERAAIAGGSDHP